MLEADHREAEQLFAQIKKSEGQERAQLIEKLATALKGHFEVEEQILYPKTEPIVGGEEVEEAENEHKIAKDALRDVEALLPDEPGLMAGVETLEAAIKHHVKDEEDEYFPKCRKEGAEVLNEIATPFMQKRAELGMEMPADALASAFTKDELAEEAKNVGIENVSSMKKEELAEALAQKMAS
jgi:iron-sulfur cluster repair protein YtfE (RIC family)